MTKNNPWKFMLKGMFSAIGYGITTIGIPLTLLWVLETYASSYFPVDAQMTFWIIAMGMIVMAFAFGRESSPKRSIRRVIFNVFLTFANMFYIYSYWFSGLANIDLSLPLPIPGLEGVVAGITLNLGTVIAIELGLIGLKFIIILYDLVDAIVYMSKRKTKINVNPGDEAADTFATYLDDGGR
jgi:glucose uptake protein GlcU